MILAMITNLFIFIFIFFLNIDRSLSLTVCNWAYNADRHRSTWSNKDDHVVVVVQGSLVILEEKEEAFLI